MSPAEIRRVADRLRKELDLCKAESLDPEILGAMEAAVDMLDRLHGAHKPLTDEQIAAFRSGDIPADHVRRVIRGYERSRQIGVM